MQPIVYGLEEEYQDRLVFDRLDAETDAGRTQLRKYSLRGHPSYVILDPQGDVLWSATGLLAEEILRTQIEESLQ